MVKRRSVFGDALGEFLNAKYRYADKYRIETGITPSQMVFTNELYAALLEKEPSLEGKSAKEQRSRMLVLVKTR